MVGALLPWWPQTKPSESCRDSHKRAEALAAGSSEPSTGATTALAQWTPAEEPPVTETPVAEVPASDAPCSDTPAPMETGGAGDGQSWAEQVEAGLEAEFGQDRPAKHHQSLSRKWEPKPMLPFPLQDMEGRLTSVLRLYKHVGEQPAPCDDVASGGIMHLHLQMLPQDARHLRNQVVCMIVEYHLTSSARVLSSLCPVLPLLPPIKSYMPGIIFEGTWYVRVLDRAKTLQVAVWLHRLDISIGGDEMASETLEALWHSLSPLLESFLAQMMSNLTFQEVVNRIRHEHQHDAQYCLDELRACCAHIRQELDELTQAHKESEKSSQKRIKKEIDMRCKDLESLKGCISQYESHLEQDTPWDNIPDSNDLLDHGAEVEMATAPGADDTPSESVTTLASDSSPQLKAMPWRWTKRVLSHLQLVLSPMRTTIC